MSVCKRKWKTSAGDVSRKKKLGLNVIFEKIEGRRRVYRIAE